MIQAYQIYEDELSSETGLPMWLTNHIDPDVQFIVMEMDNPAAAALDEWDKKKGKKAKPGVRRYVAAFNDEGELLDYGGLKRQQYRQAASQEEQDRADDIDIERDRPEGGYNPADYGDGVTDPA